MHALVNALDGSLRQAWQPFALVAGLLLIGRVAASDQLFEAIGTRLARLPGNGFVIFAALLSLVALVTAVLNLDTSVVFLTPILIQTARQRGVDEKAFLYGSIFMANGASLLLPGSNLTNMLVLATSHLRSHIFAARMVLPWVASIIVITAVLSVWRWRDLTSARHGTVASTPLRLGPGCIGIAVATVLMLVLVNPALPILTIGVVLITAQATMTHRLTGLEARKSLNAPMLVTLLVVTVSFGVVARMWSGPAHLISAAGPWAGAGIGAGLANLANNLPAAVLLSSRPLHHPLAVLIGLDLGPNLAITGALSSLLWLRIARGEGAHPSIMQFTKIGLVLTPISLVCALSVLRAVAPRSF